MIVKELFAKLGLDVDETGFNKADLLMGAAKKGLQTIAGLVVGAAVGLGAMVLHVSEVADHLDETAQATGVTTDTLQELAYAAGFSGMNVDALAGGLTKLTRNMNAAKGGSEEQAKAFAAAGVAVTGANGELRDAGDVMQDLAEHFKSMEDGPEKTALAMDLFGKSGAAMIPFLNAGRDGIAELRAEAHELGVVLDESTIKSGAEMDDSLTRLKSTLTGLQFAIAGPLLSTVTEYMNSLRKWIAANRELTMQRVEKVVGAIKVAAALLLPVIRTVLSVFGFIIDNWKLLAVLLTSVVLAALVVNAGALMSLVWSFGAAGAAGAWAGIKVGAAWVLANLPLLAMIALFVFIILLFEDVAVALSGGDSLMKNLLGDWNDDNPNDPWWLRDIKALAYLILHFDEIMKFWKDQFKDFWTYVTEGFETLGTRIKNGMKKAFGMDTDEDLRNASLSAWDQHVKDEDARLAAIAAQNPFTGTAAADPVASALSSGGASTSSVVVQSNTPITVVGSEGMSKEELAAEVAKQVALQHQQQLEEAQSGSF